MLRNTLWNPKYALRGISWWEKSIKNYLFKDILSWLFLPQWGTLGSLQNHSKCNTHLLDNVAQERVPPKSTKQPEGHCGQWCQMQLCSAGPAVMELFCPVFDECIPPRQPGLCPCQSLAWSQIERDTDRVLHQEVVTPHSLFDYFTQNQKIKEWLEMTWYSGFPRGISRGDKQLLDSTTLITPHRDEWFDGSQMFWHQDSPFKTTFCQDSPNFIRL